MWQTVRLVCALVAWHCDPPPSVALIQSAYEREETAGSTLHDTGLQVLEAKCHDNNPDGFLCEVTFISKNDPQERLYFDIVSVALAREGWELKSGLCKR
jgi:hypothetical protein